MTTQLNAAARLKATARTKRRRKINAGTGPADLQALNKLLTLTGIRVKSFQEQNGGWALDAKQYPQFLRLVLKSLGEPDENTRIVDIMHRAWIRNGYKLSYDVDINNRRPHMVFMEKQ